MNISTKPSLLHFLHERSALRGYIAICGANELASQMLNVAIGWYVYSATRTPMSLAYVGLAQFLPSIALFPLAGQAADRFDRRKVIGFSMFLQTLCLGMFCAWLAASAPSARPGAGPLYLLLLILGAARAFSSPALSAILPQMIGKDEFPRAVAASTSAFQICTILGPAIGGITYAISGPATFALATGLYFLAMMEGRVLPSERTAGGSRQHDLPGKGVLAGVLYIRSNRLLLSLISLDLFAVLLGGATALLPIYAKDILLVGPMGLGCLRCAPSAGAAVIGFVLAHRSIERSAGKRMLACVAGFGLAIVVFALSTNFVLSVTALLAAGGFDVVSMVIRQTLLQTSTPDAMRGRVSAVNHVFIGASSELGEFESGITAALFGAAPAALLGGLGTLAVVALWTVLFPELRGASEMVIAETPPPSSEHSLADA